MINHSAALALFHTFTISTWSVSHEPTWGSAVHIQTSLHLGFIVDSESPQVCDKLRVVPLEVWVVKMMIGRTVSPAVAVSLLYIFKSNIGLPEAVQVELTYKAGEVVCFEAV